MPAERVLVLSLTGSTGTDFDLYLFDSTATSVYETTGLVAKSTGPTSSEAISYATVTGGRFYIDLSGFTEVEGDYQLTVAIGFDATPPRASLAIEGGAPATNHPEVIVAVVATDDLSGVADMQFSLDGATWESWQPYSPALSRTLPEGDGPKYMWARVRDRQGNVSAAARSSILLDRVAPTVVSRSPEPGGTVPTARSAITIRFSEPIRVSSWQSLGLILQDPVGTVVYGSYAWDSATNTGTFVPGSDLQVGAEYVVSLGTIVDLAGNPLGLLSSWSIRPLQAALITLSATPRVASRGQTILLTGNVQNAAGGAITLERRAEDGTWEALEPLFPSASGAFSRKEVVNQNTTLRVSYSGNAVSAATTSPGVRILVRRSVVASGPAATIRRSAAIGQRVPVTAILGPSAPSVPVTLTLSRYNSARQTYQVVARLTRTSVTGRASFAWRGLNAGTYAVRLTTPATDRYAAGVSAIYRWTIR